MGRPVVATAVDGTDEVLRDGLDGLLVAAGYVDGVRRARRRAVAARRRGVRSSASAALGDGAAALRARRADWRGWRHPLRGGRPRVRRGVAGVVMTRMRAAAAALVERPTLCGLASAAAAALASSLVAAAGEPRAPAARVALVLGAWLGAGRRSSRSPSCPASICRGAPPAARPGGAAWRSPSTTVRTPTRRRRCWTALRAAGVRATFFLVGEAVERWPELVRRIAAEGHVIGNHTQRHRLLVFRTAAQLAEEIASCQRALERAGLHARLFRPPHGFKPLGLHRVLRAPRASSSSPGRARSATPTRRATASIVERAPSRSRARGASCSCTIIRAARRHRRRRCAHHRPLPRARLRVRRRS